MSDYDQLFKKLITAFFGDLLTIVRPSLALHTLVELTTFDSQDLFTDLKRGDHHLADLVARLTLKDAAKTVVLAHMEIEGDATAEMASRMYYYNIQLQLRERVPVFPVVIFLKGGPSGLQWNRHEVKVHEDRIIEFSYLSLGLSKMDAEALLAREEPLAWAFAAYSKARRGKAWLKLECLKRIARPGLDGVGQFLLVDAVETRLQLKNKDEAAYQVLLEKEHPQEVIEMEMTWSAQIEQRGRQEGRNEGRQERGRELLTRLLNKRFGLLSQQTVKKLTEIKSEEQLDDLAERLLTARSLEELGLV